MGKKTDASDGLQDTARLLGVSPSYLRGGLNLTEAGELLGIAPSTVRRRARQGKLGFQRDGRAWRFFWWHLRDYLRRREHGSDLSGADKPDRTGREPEGDILERAEQMGLT